MAENKIIHEGEITLGEMVIPCYVLEDGTRVLSGNAMQNAFKETKIPYDIHVSKINEEGTKLITN